MNKETGTEAPGTEASGTKRPGGPLRDRMNAAGGNLPKWSEIFPFVVAIRPGFLGRLNWPVVAPTVFVALMSSYLVNTNQYLFGTNGDQVTVTTNIGYYLDLLGAYILYIEFYFIYMLCGKRVSWLPCIAAAAVVYVFLQSPPWDVAYGAFDKLGSLFDPNIISGSDTVDNSPFFLRFLGDTFSIGLREELVKALPAIALAVSYLYFNSARSDRFGVTEPLDGILICVAAAAAFSLSETFSQYIYQNNDQIAHFFQVNFPKSSIDLSNLTGLVDAKTNDDTGRATLYIGSLYVAANAFEVLIFRMFQDLCGHMLFHRAVCPQPAAQLDCPAGGLADRGSASRLLGFQQFHSCHGRLRADRRARPARGDYQGETDLAEPRQQFRIDHAQPSGLRTTHSARAIIRCANLSCCSPAGCGPACSGSAGNGGADSRHRFRRAASAAAVAGPVQDRYRPAVDPFIGRNDFEYR
jgi:RsiW-degrading membrane proteinase PrsW (M82 family)